MDSLALRRYVPSAVTYDLPSSNAPPDASARAPRIAMAAFTVLAIALVLVAGVRTILHAIRDGSPGVRAAERLERGGLLQPIGVEWSSAWALGALEPASWDPGGAALARVQPLKGLTVINLWATWCEPCRAELPSLVALAREVPEATFLLIGYDLAWDQPKAFVRDVFEGIPKELVFARDPLGNGDGEQSAETYWRRLGASGIPETFFVRDGVVVAKFVGGVDFTHRDVVAYLHALAGR